MADLTSLSREGNEWVFTLAIVGVMAAVFSFDLLMPLGVAGGVPYVIAVLISLRARRHKLTLRVSVGCSLLTLVGLVLSPPGNLLWMVLVNRGLALFVIWVTAGLGMWWMTAERTHRRSDMLYRSLFQHSNDGLILHREDGTVIDANPKACELLGYTLSEFRELKVHDLHPTNISEIFAGNVQRLRSKERVYLAIDFKRKDESVFPAEISAGLFDMNGEQFVIAAVRDVTERVQAQQQLGRERELYETLFQESPGMYVVTRNQAGTPIVERCNERFLRTLGWAADEVVGRPLSDFYTPASRESLTSYGYRQALQGVFVDEERELVTRDGRVIATIARAVPVTDAHGKVIGTRGLFVDITERKRVEEALRESEGMTRRIIETSPDAVLMVNSDRCIILVNRRAEQIFGYSREEMLGESIDMLVPERYRDAHARHGADFTATPHVRTMSASMELAGRRKDGSTIPLEIGLSPIETRDGLCVISLVRDISKRKQAEETLRRSHADLRALAARLHHVREEERAKMARDVHDQLGQALTGLKMDLSLLRRHLPKDSTALQEETGSMQAACDATIEMVRNVAQELRPSVLDSHGLAAAIEWEVRQFQERSGIACELDIKAEVAGVDSNRAITVYRILQEALTNVVRHAQATRVQIELEQTNETLVLHVQDDGGGFIEGEEPGSRSLGIVGMRERAIAWGGEVTIGSAPGKGTMVSLRMPLPQGKERQPAPGE